MRRTYTDHRKPSYTYYPLWSPMVKYISFWSKSLYRSHAGRQFYGTKIDIWAGLGPVGSTEKKIGPIMSNFYIMTLIIMKYPFLWGNYENIWQIRFWACWGQRSLIRQKLGICVWNTIKIRRWVAAHMCVLLHFRTCNVRAEVRAERVWNCACIVGACGYFLTCDLQSHFFNFSENSYM